MHDLITNIQFVAKTVDSPGVSGNSALSTSAQTGDFLAILISLLCIIFTLCFIFLYNKHLKSNKTTASPAKHAANAQIVSGISKKAIALIIALLFVFTSIVFISTKSLYSFAAESASTTSQADRMIPEKLTVYVDEQTGEMTWDDFTLTNSANRLKFKTSSVSTTAEVLDITALQNSSLEFKGLNSVLYSGNPDGKDFAIDTAVKRMTVGETTKISYSLDGIDANLAKQLIGKTAFEVHFKAIETLVQAPQAVDNLTYNGQNQIGVPSGYGYSISGNQQKDAGDYQAVAKLETYDDPDVTWLDNTSADKNIPWKINQSTIELNDINVDYTYKGSSFTEPPMTVAASSIFGNDEVSITATSVYKIPKNSTNLEENELDENLTDEIIDAGQYQITALAISNSNYALPESSKCTKTFSVKQVPVEIKDWDQIDFTFNTQSQHPKATLEYNKVAGEEVEINSYQIRNLRSNDPNENSIDASDYTIKADGLKAKENLTDTKAENYKIINSAETNYKINPYQVFPVSWESDRFIYDTNPHYHKATLNSLPSDFAGQALSGDYEVHDSSNNKIDPEEAKDAGWYTVKVTGLKAENEATKASNYELVENPNPQGASHYNAYQIEKRGVVAQWTNPSFPYNGQEQKLNSQTEPKLLIMVSEIVGITSLDAETKVYKQGTDTEVSPKDAGKYTEKITGLFLNDTDVSKNFYVENSETSKDSFDYEISKKTLTLSNATDIPEYNGYAQEIPDPELGDFVEGESLKVAGKQLKDVNEAINAGTYSVYALDLTKDGSKPGNPENYSLPPNNTYNFSISKRQVDITWGSLSHVYDANPYCPSAYITSVFNEIISLNTTVVPANEDTEAEEETSQYEPKDKGDYKVKASLNDNLPSSNYSLDESNDTADYKITECILEFEWTWNEKVYNESQQNPEVKNVLNIPANEEPDVKNKLAASCFTDYTITPANEENSIEGESKNAGDYKILVNSPEDLSSNYKLTTNQHEYTINKATPQLEYNFYTSFLRSSDDPNQPRVYEFEKIKKTEGDLKVSTTDNEYINVGVSGDSNDKIKVETMSLTADSVAVNYSLDESQNYYASETKTQYFEIKDASAVPVSVMGYNGVYDGAGHQASINKIENIPDGATVQIAYSVDGGNVTTQDVAFTDKKANFGPKIKDVPDKAKIIDYVLYYTDDYGTVTHQGQVTLNVNPATVKPQWNSEYSFEYNAESQQGVSAYITDAIGNEGKSLAFEYQSLQNNNPVPAINVGNYKNHITGISSEDDSVKASNYQLPQDELLYRDFSITPHSVLPVWPADSSGMQLNYNAEDQLLQVSSLASSFQSPNETLTQQIGSLAVDSYDVSLKIAPEEYLKDGQHCNVGYYVSYAKTLKSNDLNVKTENFKLQESSCDFSIVPAKVSISWPEDTQTYIYNGYNQAPFDKYAISGVLEKDSNKLEVSAFKVQNADTEVTDYKNVADDYKLFATSVAYKSSEGISSQNYVINAESLVASCNFKIVKKEVQLNWHPTTYVYNGKPQPNPAVDVLTGVNVPGETLLADQINIFKEDGTPSATLKDAGKYKAQVMSLKSPDGSSSNYISNYSVPTTQHPFSIAKADTNIEMNTGEVTVNTLDTYTTTFTFPDFCPGENIKSAIVSGDLSLADVSISANDGQGTLSVATKDKGSITIKVYIEQTNNYNYSEVSKTINIKNKTFQVEAVGYDGPYTAEDHIGYIKVTEPQQQLLTSKRPSKSPELTNSSNGTVVVQYRLEDDATQVYSANLSDDKYPFTDLKVKDVNSIKIKFKVSKKGFDDYTGTLKIIVKPVDVSLSWGNVSSHTYDATAFSPEVSVVGLCESDKGKIKVKDYLYSANNQSSWTSEKPVDVGSYFSKAISLCTNDAPTVENKNYKISSNEISGKYSITQKSLDLDWDKEDGATYEYNPLSASSPIATLNQADICDADKGILSLNPLTYQEITSSGKIKVDSTKDAGSYCVTASLATSTKSQNYQLTDNNFRNYTIVPIDPQLQLNFRSNMLALNSTNTYQYFYRGDGVFNFEVIAGDSHLANCEVGASTKQDDGRNKGLITLETNNELTTDTDKVQVQYSVSATKNYKASSTITKEFNVADFTPVEVLKIDQVYDGYSHSPEVKFTKDNVTANITIDYNVLDHEPSEAERSPESYGYSDTLNSGTQSKTLSDASIKDVNDGTKYLVYKASAKDENGNDIYTPNKAVVQLKINPKPLSVTWENPDSNYFVYNGEGKTINAQLSGFVSEEEKEAIQPSYVLSGQTVDGLAINVGTYQRSVQNIDASGDIKASNYLLPSSGLDKEFEITPATISFVWPAEEARNLTYNSQTQKIAVSSINGLEDRDTGKINVGSLTVYKQGSSQALVDSQIVNVGDYNAKVASLSSTDVNSNPTYNYTWIENLQPYKIVPAPLTVEWPTAAADLTRQYMKNKWLPTAKLNNICQSDVNKIWIKQFNVADQTTHAAISSYENVGKYQVNANGLKDTSSELVAQNYYISNTDNSCNFEITPKLLEILWDVPSYTYDGQAKPAPTAHVIIDTEKDKDFKVSEVQITKDNQVIQLNNIKDAGTYNITPVKISPLPGSNEQASNYSFAQTPQQFVIDKASINLEMDKTPVDLTVPQTHEFTIQYQDFYDGQNSILAASNNTSVAEVAYANNKVNVTSKDAGLAKIKVELPETSNCYSAVGYKDYNVALGTLQFETSGYNNVYDAQSHSANIKLTNSDSVTIKYWDKNTPSNTHSLELTKGQLSEFSEEPIKNAGSKTICWETSPKTGYEFASGQIQLSVSPKELPLTWESVSSYTYDGQTHSPNASVVALAGEQIEVASYQYQANIDGAAWLSGDANKPKNHGSYITKATGLKYSDDDNPSINYVIKENTQVSAPYKIEPRVAEITWSDDRENPYSGNIWHPTATITNLVSGDNLQLNYQLLKQDGIEWKEDSSVNAGSYKAIVSFDEGNYKLPDASQTTCQYKITPIDPQFTVDFYRTDLLQKSSYYFNYSHLGDGQLKVQVPEEFAEKISCRVNLNTKTIILETKQVEQSCNVSINYWLDQDSLGNYNIVRSTAQEFSIKNEAPVDVFGYQAQYEPGKTGCATARVSELVGYPYDITVEYWAEGQTDHFTTTIPANSTAKVDLNDVSVQNVEDTKILHYKTTTQNIPSSEKNINLTVTPVEIDFSWPEQKTFTYDGQANPNRYQASISESSGVYDTEISKLTLTNYVHYDSEGNVVPAGAIDVGTYQVQPSTIISLEESVKASNYTLPDLTTLTANRGSFTINKKEVHVTWNNEQHIYDGEEWLPGFALNDADICVIDKNILAVNEEDIAITSNSQPVTSHKDTAQYQASAKSLIYSDPTIEKPMNYSIADNSSTFNIVPREVITTWQNDDYVYTGQQLSKPQVSISTGLESTHPNEKLTVADISKIAITDIIDGDEKASEIKNASENYKAFLAEGALSLPSGSSALLKNYKIPDYTEEPGKKYSFVVQKATPQITMESTDLALQHPANYDFNVSYSTFYDGTAQVSSILNTIVSTSFSSGKVSGSTLHDGTDRINFVLPATSNCNEATAYRSVTVSKGNLQVTEIGWNNFYDGNEHKAKIKINNTDVTNANVEYYVEGSSTYTATASSGNEYIFDQYNVKNAGSITVEYQITVDSYNTYSSHVDLVVSPLAVDLTWTGSTSDTYDGLEHAPTAAKSGSSQIPSGESIEVKEYRYSADSGTTWTSTKPVNAGTYKVKAISLCSTNSPDQVNNNYLISETTAVSGVFSITKKTVDVTWENVDTMPYNPDSEWHPFATLSGIIERDKPLVEYKYSYKKFNAGDWEDSETSKDCATYKVFINIYDKNSASQAEPQNYTINTQLNFKEYNITQLDPLLDLHFKSDQISTNATYTYNYSYRGDGNFSISAVAGCEKYLNGDILVTKSDQPIDGRWQGTIVLKTSSQTTTDTDKLVITFNVTGTTNYTAVEPLTRTFNISNYIPVEVPNIDQTYDGQAHIPQAKLALPEGQTFSQDITINYSISDNPNIANPSYDKSAVIRTGQTSCSLEDATITDAQTKYLYYKASCDDTILKKTAKVELKINKKQLGISWNEPYSIEYTGETKADWITANLSTGIEDQAVSPTGYSNYSPSATTYDSKAKNAGSYTSSILGFKADNLNTNANNYYIPQDLTITKDFEITPATIDFSWPAVAGRTFTYNAQTQKISATITGLKDADNGKISISNYSFTKAGSQDELTDSQLIDADNYTAHILGIKSSDMVNNPISNYVWNTSSNLNCDYSITKKEVSVTWTQGSTKAYFAANWIPYFTTSGIIESDKNSVSVGGWSVTDYEGNNTTDWEDVGDYNVSATKIYIKGTEEESPNYSLASNNVDFSITQKELVLDWVAPSPYYVYDGQEKPCPDVNIQTGITGQSLVAKTKAVYSVATPDETSQPVEAIDAGSYYAQLKEVESTDGSANPANYTFSSATYPFVINKAQIHLSATQSTVEIKMPHSASTLCTFENFYDGVESDFIVTTSNNCINASYNRSTSCIDAQTQHVGIAYVTLKLNDTQNCIGASVKITYNISQGDASIETQDYTGVYDGHYHYPMIKFVSDFETVNLRLESDSNIKTISVNKSDDFIPLEDFSIKDVGTISIHYQSTNNTFVKCSGTITLKVTPAPISYVNWRPNTQDPAWDNSQQAYIYDGNQHHHICDIEGAVNDEHPVINTWLYFKGSPGSVLNLGSPTEAGLYYNGGMLNSNNYSIESGAISDVPCRIAPADPNLQVNFDQLKPQDTHDLISRGGIYEFPVTYNGDGVFSAEVDNDSKDHISAEVITKSDGKQYIKLICKSTDTEEREVKIHYRLSEASSGNYLASPSNGGQFTKTFTIKDQTGIYAVEGYNAEYDGLSHYAKVSLKDGTASTANISIKYGDSPESLNYSATLAKNAKSVDLPAISVTHVDDGIKKLFVKIIDASLEQDISTLVTLQVKPRTISATWTTEQFEYDGYPHQHTYSNPTGTLEGDVATLSDAVVYSSQTSTTPLTQEQLKNAGTYYEAAGIQSITSASFGSKKSDYCSVSARNPYIINKRSLSHVKIDFDNCAEVYRWDNYEHEIKLSITDNASVGTSTVDLINLETDCQITGNLKASAVGTYNIIINGKDTGNYTGDRSVFWCIYSQDELPTWAIYNNEGSKLRFVRQAYSAAIDNYPHKIVPKDWSNDQYSPFSVLYSKTAGNVDITKLVKTVEFDDNMLTNETSSTFATAYKPKSTTAWFYNFENLDYCINFKNLYFGENEQAINMFAGTKLNAIDLSQKLTKKLSPDKCSNMFNIDTLEKITWDYEWSQGQIPMSKCGLPEGVWLSDDATPYELKYGDSVVDQIPHEKFSSGKKSFAKSDTQINVADLINNGKIVDSSENTPATIYGCSHQNPKEHPIKIEVDSNNPAKLNIKVAHAPVDGTSSVYSTTTWTAKPNSGSQFIEWILPQLDASGYVSKGLNTINANFIAASNTYSVTMKAQYGTQTETLHTFYIPKNISEDVDYQIVINPNQDGQYAHIELWRYYGEEFSEPELVDSYYGYIEPGFNFSKWTKTSGTATTLNGEDGVLAFIWDVESDCVFTMETTASNQLNLSSPNSNPEQNNIEAAVIEDNQNIVQTSSNNAIAAEHNQDSNNSVKDLLTNSFPLLSKSLTNFLSFFTLV